MSRVLSTAPTAMIDGLFAGMPTNPGAPRGAAHGLRGSWPCLAGCMWAGWRRIVTFEHHALGC